MSSFKIGNLVIFHGKFAIVTTVTLDKIGISIDNGDSKNVRPKDIEFLHPGPVKGFPLDVPKTEPDKAEIAELMGDETMSFSDFTELAYSEYTPATACAALALLNENLYFTGSVAEGVKANAPDFIAKKLQEAKEKAEAKARYNERVERIRTNTLLPEDLPALREIEEVAYGRNDSSKLLMSLGIEAIPEKAHRLLLNLNAWTYATNPFPARFGVEMDDPDFSPVVPTNPVPREDLTYMNAYAIDDEGSNDPDDAISFHDGLFWVHISDPLDAIEFGSEIDLEARRRGVNNYLPEKTSRIFPEWVTKQYGLGLNETSPALSFAMKFNEDGEPELVKMVLSTVKVTRLTYTADDEALSFPEFEQMKDLMRQFRNFRARNEAVFIQLPEVKIHADAEGKVDITPLPITPVREMVANAMIATGYVVAKWAIANDITMPFVTQEKMSITVNSDDMGDLPLSEMFSMRAASRPGRMGVEPGPHSGLGLNCYVRATSPLRRYCDLLAHQQIRRYLLNQELIDYQTMDSLVFNLEQPMTSAKYLERYCREYWTLVWMTQQPEDKVLEAVPVKRMFGKWIFIIPEIAYQYKCGIHGGIMPDVPVLMKIQAANPVSLQSRMKIIATAQAETQSEAIEVEEEELSDTIDKESMKED